MARRMASFILGLTLGLLWAQPARAQLEEQLGVPTDIEKAFKAETVFKILTNENPSMNDKLMLDNAAKYFVWRVTWLDNLANLDKLAAALKDFDRDYTNRVVKNKDIKNSPVSFFHVKLVESFKAVFDRKFESNRVSTMQAALLLPIVARGKDAAFSDFLTKIVKDPDKHDAVKLYAIKGLREYFPVRAIGPDSGRDKKTLAADFDRVQTLVDYIERKWPETSAKDEVDAHCYLRREAVHALAHAQAPALFFQKKVEGEVATALIKILAKDILQPPPSLTEKYEAAIGVCNMKLSDIPDYQPQAGIYAVGVTLADFFDAYRRDFANVSDKKKVGLLPYKSLADRFKQGLDNLQNNTSPHPKAKEQAKYLYDRSKSMLDLIILHKQVENASAVDFRSRDLDRLKTDDFKLFKSKNVSVDLGY